MAIKSDVVPNPPYANMAGAAKLTSENTDAVIQQVMDWYDGALVGWFWGPAYTPTNLPERLAAHGLQRAEVRKNMVLDHLDLPIGTVPGIEVRLVSPEEMDQAAPILAEAHGMGSARVDVA